MPYIFGSILVTETSDIRNISVWREVRSICPIVSISQITDVPLGLIFKYVHRDDMDILKACFGFAMHTNSENVLETCTYLKFRCEEPVKFFYIHDSDSLGWLSATWESLYQKLSDNKLPGHRTYVFDCTNFYGWPCSTNLRKWADYYATQYLDYSRYYRLDGRRYVMEEWYKFICDEIDKRIEIIV